MKAYVVFQEEGEYSDRQTWALGVFTSKEKAQKLADHVETLINEKLKNYELAEMVIDGTLSLKDSGLTESEVDDEQFFDPYTPRSIWVEEYELDEEDIGKRV